jgi:ComF family protein
VNIKSAIKKSRTADALLSFIYPHRCPICDGALPVGEHGICPGCIDKIRYVREPFCMKCGRPLDEEAEYCELCTDSHREFDAGRSACLYDRYIRQSIIKFKYYGRQEYADSYADMILYSQGDFIRSVHPDVLVPVPIHKKRMDERHYNQAALIADSLSEKSCIPSLDDLLVRERFTRRQKDLNREERRKNLKGAFKVNKKYKLLNQIPESVMIIDDILTTGSTLDECSFALKEAGVENVYYIVLSCGKL